MTLPAGGSWGRIRQVRLVQIAIVAPVCLVSASGSNDMFRVLLRDIIDLLQLARAFAEPVLSNPVNLKTNSL